jgi:hypothetical protein
MTDQITIAGHPFDVPVRYAEGHQLTAGEASALNQTFHENIRNNIASKIKKSTPEGAEFSWDDSAVSTWQSEVNKYAEEYQFGVRSGGGRGPAMDPETKLAVEEAEAAIVMGVKSQGQTPPKGKDLRALAHQVLDGPQGDRFRALARRRLRATQEAANSVIGDLLKAAE